MPFVLGIYLLFQFLNAFFAAVLPTVLIVSTAVPSILITPRVFARIARLALPIRHANAPITTSPPIACFVIWPKLRLIAPFARTILLTLALRSASTAGTISIP